MSLASCRIPSRIFRVSFSTNPAALPDWKRVGNGRFDDPLRGYRVLYTSASRVGAFIERLQDFRPDEEMIQLEHEFIWDEDISERDRELPSGTVPYSEYFALYIGTYVTDTEAVLLDLTMDATARSLSDYLGTPLTVAAIAGDNPLAAYPLSRRISRIGYEHEPSFVGIYSASKLHPTTVTNVSLFEGENEELRVQVYPAKVETVDWSDPSLQEACTFLGITLQHADDYFSQRIYLYGP